MLDNLPGSSGAADISSPDEPGKEDKTTCIIVTKATKTARMTGQPVPGETIPSPNNTPVNYNIGGTDLGIFWKMSDNKVGILFGDTYKSMATRQTIILADSDQWTMMNGQSIILLLLNSLRLP